MSFYSAIDDYVKDSGLGEVSILCSFTIHTALKLGKQALKSYLKITCDFQHRSPPNKKVSAAKDYG